MSEWLLWLITAIFLMMGLSGLIEGRWLIAMYGIGAFLVNLAVVLGLK